MFYYVAGFYLLAWTPYAIISMVAAFGDVSAIPEVVFTWLAFFAKLSFMLNPIAYSFSNKHNR